MPSQYSNEFHYVMSACCRALLFVAIFSFFVNLLMLVVPLYMLQLFDRVILGRSEATLLYLTLIALFALIVFGLLDMLRSRLLVRLSIWIDERLAPEAFSKVIRVSFHLRRSQAQLLSAIQDVRNFFAGNALLSLLDAFWIPVYIGVIYLLHPMVALVAVGAVIVFVILALLNEFLTRAPQRQVSESSAKAQEQAESTVRNAEVVNALGMTSNVVNRWMQTYGQTLATMQIAHGRARTFLSIAKSWRLMIQVLVLGTGAYFVLQRELGPGGMIAGSILMARALAPIEGAIDTWRQVLTVRMSLRKLRDFFSNQEKNRENLPLPAPKGQMALRGVVYVYPGAETAVVRGVSFDIAVGEVLAVIGPSGAGKSTLARLLTGIYRPTTGSVRLDGADIASWDREQLGPYLGYLPQDVELFAGTVGENIARFGLIDSEAIIAAARLANVHEMILQFPKGYDTEIGEAGAVLSGGQRQRIGLARAVFGIPRLLILDEPNSNLDAEGEQALQEAIGVLKDHKTTVIMIAHRPSMLKHVDRVLVMSEGRVQAIGNRDEILKQFTRPQAVANRPEPQRVAQG